jgi:rhodanese-related sulfurtransferase
MEEWFKAEEFAFAVMAAALAFFGIKLLPRLLAGVPFAPPNELKEKMERRDDVLVLDVREPSEYTDDLGHIPGALNVPLSSLSNKIEALKPDLMAYKDTPVYVVCRTSNRSASAARILKKAGLDHVKVVSGGMVRWKQTGLPSGGSA